MMTDVSIATLGRLFQGERKSAVGRYFVGEASPLSLALPFPSLLKPPLGELLWGEMSRNTTTIRPIPFSFCIVRRWLPVRPEGCQHTFLECARQHREALRSLSLESVRTSKPSCSRSAMAGTILLSGPLRPKASFGSPEGHSLRLGTSACAGQWASSSRTMDALLRFRPVRSVLRETGADAPRGSPLACCEPPGQAMRSSTFSSPDRKSTRLNS